MRHNQPGRHILLTALGTSPRQTTYSLDGKTADAEHAPLALLELLKRPEARPDKVLCLLTEKARETVWKAFANQVASLGVEIACLHISNADSSAEISGIIDDVANAIPRESKLTLDITHGPRHIPFVFYALALFMSSFRGVEIVNAWYGKYESEGDTKPLITLKPLLELPQWFYAVRMFQETGYSKTLAARFDVLKNALPQDRSRGPASNMAKTLREFSHHYESGFPLELGLAAGSLSYTLEERSLDAMLGLNVPLARELGDAIQQAATPYRLASDRLKDGRGAGDWKTQYALNKEELQRQATLIDQYLERGQLADAIGLMREWVVSLGVLYRGDPTHWLNRGARMKTERELGAMSQPALRDGLSEEQKAWGSFWDQLGKVRNQFAHHGMKQEVAKAESGLPGGAQSFWDGIKSANQAWKQFGGGKGCLLVTPLGMSPGVLYSAIQRTNPDAVLVLCSEQAKTGIEEALQHASYSGMQHVFLMRDPFNGFAEITELLSRSRRICLDADEIVVNLTGGTTMLGIAVQRFFEQARNDQRPCRRFVLTDTRSMEDQKNDPWVVSDIYWLDKATDEETVDD